MLCLCLSGNAALAQFTGDSLYYLLPPDTVQLYVSNNGSTLLHDHHLAPVQTLYGAAKFYGVDVEDVYAFRPQLRQGYDVGSVASIPVPPALIRREIPQDSLAWFVPVTYRLPATETVFGLATRRLGWLNTAPMQILNPDVNLDRVPPDYPLLIGYLPVAGFPRTTTVYGDIWMRQNQSLRRLWDARAGTAQLNEARGKAAWSRRSKGENFLVLHRTAPVNSLIEITDPRSRKTLVAKVIGPVPEQLYEPDVIVVINPYIAKAFGVRDREFYVKLRHF